MNLPKIGRQIKKARIEKDLNQNELGDMLGVTWEMISRYENARSNPTKHLEKLSEILEKPLNYFLVSDFEYKLNNNLDILEDNSKFSYNIKSDNRVPFLKKIDTSKTIDENIKESNHLYNIPDWVIEKYDDIFSLKLKEIDSDFVEFTDKDIGIFAIEDDYLEGNLILTDNKSILRFNSSIDKENIIGILIYLERRFY